MCPLFGEVMKERHCQTPCDLRSATRSKKEVVVVETSKTGGDQAIECGCDCKRIAAEFLIPSDFLNEGQIKSNESIVCMHRYWLVES